uniref:Peptidase S1 domain-containing protein n=1 Tax=Anopheles dirus TaxID=7168 RepID=A0A182N966_9DIPT
MICAGNRDGIGPCNGDSGGGLFFDVDDVWYIRGMVSFTKPRNDSNKSDLKQYTVFTDIAKYLDWIQSYMRGKGELSAASADERDLKIGLLPVATCGYNPYADKDEELKPLAFGYPWLGTLSFIENATRKHYFVMVTVLSDRYVLSTANVINNAYRNGSTLLNVTLGEYRFNESSHCGMVHGRQACAAVQELRIEKVILHERYRYLNGSHMNNIALIRLLDRVDLSQPNVKPICLPLIAKLQNEKLTEYVVSTFNLKLTRKMATLFDRNDLHYKQYNRSLDNSATFFMVLLSLRLQSAQNHFPIYSQMYLPTIASVVLLLLVISSESQSCGKRKVTSLLIQNGNKSKDGFWPWHAVLYHKSHQSLAYACGGSIIDQNTILTAAHCLVAGGRKIALELLIVQVGRSRLWNFNNWIQQHDAYELIVHPDYNAIRVGNDLALIKLSSDISYNQYVQPICLWDRDDAEHKIVGTFGTVIGFGLDESDMVSESLREARVPVVSLIQCLESNPELLGTLLTSRMICAGNRDGIGPCNGDSGGGLFFDFDNVWYIRGMVSFTKPREDTNTCDLKQYTVFTDIAKYLDWMRSHLRGRGELSPASLHLNIERLPIATCGYNPYADREEAPNVTLGEYEENNPTHCGMVNGKRVCAPVQNLRIEKIIVHKEFKLTNTFVNNIALIRLLDRADLSQPNVKPICLPFTAKLRNEMLTEYVMTMFSGGIRRGEMTTLLDTNESTIASVVLFVLVVSSESQSCGKRKVASLLIHNGDESKDGFWPWHAVLYDKTGHSQAYACGGSIIDQNTILTAAHCLVVGGRKIALERLIVQVGRSRLWNFNNWIQQHDAYELIVHPEYSAIGVGNDLALIKLSSDISYNQYVQPICLWDRDDAEHKIVGALGTVIGFGFDESDMVSGTLREARLPVISLIQCLESNRELFGTQLTSRMVCAGNRDGIGPCNGDSGGGLFFSFDEVWYIRGMVSFTKPREDTTTCDLKQYTVFTDIAKYLDWIRSHLRVRFEVYKTSSDERDLRIRLLPVSTCGYNPYADREEEIKPLTFGYPWIGKIISYSNVTKRVEDTTVTLISDRFALSTARFFDYAYKANLTVPNVKLGMYNYMSTHCGLINGERVCAAVQNLRIEKVIIHEEYQPWNGTFINNFALIRLLDRANLSQPNVKPICLPFTEKLRNEKLTEYVLVEHFDYEWRRSVLELCDRVECQGNLKEHFLILVRNQNCVSLKQKSVNKPTREVVRAGSSLQAVQQVLGEQRYVLQGVGEFHVFEKSYINLFVSVATYIDWILDNIQR